MARVGFAVRASMLAASLALWPAPARSAPTASKPAAGGALPDVKKAAPPESAAKDQAPAAPSSPPSGTGSKAEETKPAGPKVPPQKSETKPSPAKTGDSKPPGTKAGESKAGQSKTGESKASPSKLEKGKAESSKPPAAEPTPPAAETNSAPDPQRGAGTRSVEPLFGADTPNSGQEPSVPLKGVREPQDKPAPRASHQLGKPPRKPSPTLPAGVARPSPDRVARQKIAEGLTDEDLRAGKDDPELRSLRAAERVLFPRPLMGLEPGWSWDLPEARSVEGPEVTTQGTPTFGPGISRRAGSRREAVEGAPDAAWLKSLTLPNLPVVLDEFVIKYLRFYRDSPSGKAIARVWTKKSGRYTQAIRAELARAGVPTDLVWLSMIESGHNPSIASPAGAAGLWQFMPDAGRTYGLTVDRWVDERLDPERSTQAASRYLSDLYRRFGSWELAIASYNMGYGGLARSIRKFNSNDFWELVRYEAGIPWETTLYVPKIFALAIVMNNKTAFGLDAVETDAPEPFDIVLVGPSVALSDVAKAAGVAENTLNALNPGILAGRTPPWVPGALKPSWRVRVPVGKGTACTQALARTAGDDDTLQAYVTKFGETVESVANSHGVSEARLRALNHVEPKEVLAAGTVLLVPRAARVMTAPNDDVVVVPPREFAYDERSRIFYRVLPGDTLSRVASVFAVNVAEIGSWNALDEGARLQSGMALQLFVSKDKKFSARTLEASKTHLLIAGSPEFYDYFEAQNGRKRVVVSARENDTLGTLGKRYGMTVGSMERINRRSRTDKLHAADQIVVYVDRGRQVASHKASSEPDDLATGTLLPLEPALDAPAPDAPQAPAFADGAQGAEDAAPPEPGAL